MPLGLGLSRAALLMGTVLPVAPPPAGEVVTAMIMGQSELHYTLDPAANYNQIGKPMPGDGNLIVWTQVGSGNAPVRTLVNAATVATGKVNPAMAAVSAFLQHVTPGKTYVLGDGAVAGTGRYDLSDDSTDGSDGRLWGDFASVANAIEAEFGPVQHLIECWYSNDAGRVATFRQSFWPFYFGANADGTRFELGGTVNARRIDHCLYDASAAPGEKGRGLFARGETDWTVLTPMPFHGAPDAPDEIVNFSSGSSTMIEPRRANIRALADDALAQSVGIRTGPSAHISYFGGGIHPVTDNPDGQILLAWPIALGLLRASGMPIAEPSVIGIDGSLDGTYADLLVDLPNGGDLTTLAAVRGTADIADHPHQQEVTGIEITRADSNRRPVFRTERTERAEAFRGTVEIVDAGSGNPRRGRVRITPTVPFAFGESLSYLRGQATASLQKPRDNTLYQWLLIEHVPAFYDANATYPMEGIAVRPYQEELTVPVEAADFAARAAHFDGTSYFQSANDPNIAPGSKGLMSVWIRNSDSVWNAAARRVFQFNVGTTIVLDLYTASSGRMTFRLNNDTSSDITAFYAGMGNTSFELNRWYHLMIAWTATGLAIYVNGALIDTKTFASVDMAGQILARMGIGASVAGNTPWVGDIGHLYINIGETLDLSQPANRAKFIADGAPVNLGANGHLPTGTAPAFYYDGDAPAWANQGTASNIPVTNALTPSTTVPELAA